MLIFINNIQGSQVILTKLQTVLLSIFAYQKAYIEKQSGFKIKAVRYNNALEYKAIEGPILLKEGITLELIVVYLLQQNRVAEQLNRTLVIMARSILQYAKLLLRFWGFVVIIVYYLQNRMPIRLDRTFSYIIYANIPKETCGKLKLVARKIILVRYLLILKQYQLYNLIVKEVIIALALIFNKDKFQEQLDELKELSIDIESLDPIRLVNFNLSELLETHTDVLRADSLAVKLDSG